MPVGPINAHFHRKPKQNGLINDYFHSTASPAWHQPIKRPPKRSGPDRAAQGCADREDDEKTVRSTDFSAN
jgi:hypothetical protein